MFDPKRVLRALKILRNVVYVSHKVVLTRVPGAGDITHEFTIYPKYYDHDGLHEDLPEYSVRVVVDQDSVNHAELEVRTAVDLARGSDHAIATRLLEMADGN